MILPSQQIGFEKCGRFVVYHVSMTEPAASSLRSAFQSEKERLAKRFLESGASGKFLEKHCCLVDRLIQELVDQHQNKSRYAVLATGGYGRKELFPASDIDLLIVTLAGEEQQVEPIIRALLCDLWDARLDLGHQVWSLDQLQGLSLEHEELLLSLLDARFVAGDAALGREVVKRVMPGFVERKGADLIGRIGELTEERHLASENTIYQLEPDLKLSPGGLRDALAADWLDRLQQNRPFLSSSPEEMTNARRFLARLRILVHLLSGRNQNQLTHKLQEQILPYVGLEGEEARPGVESLMKRYFLNAGILHRRCRKYLQAARPEFGRNWIEPFEIPALTTMGEILSAFQCSLQEQRPLSEQVHDAIAGALPGASAEIRFPSLRKSLPELLRPRPGLYRVLSEMYELGVLERLFPEFGTVKARVIRDFHHKYTVDEHTLVAIRNIEELTAAPPNGDRRFGALLQETDDPWLLILALLLHDVGKCREGEHAARSTRMAASALKRFRIPRAESEIVLFLIRSHLEMAAVILRRDLEDPQVIRRFAGVVGDTPRLRLLCLLTYADMKAVAPGTLNEWKRDLLWQLYVSTYHQLTFGFGEERIAEKDISEKLVSGLGPELDPEDFERFLEGFPTRYLQNTPGEEIYDHFRLACQLRSGRTVTSRLVNRRSHFELWMVARDRFRLFAKVVGLLSYFEMNILRGYGFSNRRRIVLDFFQFRDGKGFFRKNPEEMERFRFLLEEAVADRISVRQLLQRKEQSVLFRPRVPPFPPTLYFEDEQSERYSILEIIAPDSIGLLYRISREIARSSCDIELALISTEGEKAVDVFYLSHQGGKLPQALQCRLQENILTAIG